VVTFASTVTVLVLLFSYHTSTNQASASALPVAAARPRATAPAASAPAKTPSAGPSAAATPSAPAAATTYLGPATDTRWGIVQVQVTVTGGKVTDSQAVQVPNGNGRDDEINSVAVPILNSEVLAAQSAQIDTVSGATVTSDGYVTSLQGALSAAGLA
jgi:uncharacterized protein with FMN-binding domain